MRLLIHDLTDKELEKLLPKLDDNIKILSNTKEIHKCIGCLALLSKTYLIKALIIFFHTL